MDVIIRQNENGKVWYLLNTSRLCLFSRIIVIKFARAFQNYIDTGLHEMWKVRQNKLLCVLGESGNHCTFPIIRLNRQ